MGAPARNSPYRLIVEGQDDQFTIINLLERHGYDWQDESRPRPFIHNAGGVDRLLESLSVIAKSSHSRIGIVADANGDLSGRWTQICDRLGKEGIHLPDKPEPGGTLIDGPGNGRKIGIWLMPDNLRPGALEDLLVTLVPEEDPCWAYAGLVVEGARERGARCRAGDHVKSTVHTWLAWQENPGVPYGVALKANYLTHASDTAVAFVQWFRKLFA